MSALFPDFEREVPGLDAAEINGKALGEAAEKLHKVSTELCLPPLMDFFDSRSMAEQLCDPDELDFDSLPPTQWYTATEGLKTIRGLRAYLSLQQEDDPNRAWIIQDLNDIERQLIIAEEQSIGFHWLLDI